MSRTLLIELLHLPYRELSPNARVHWAKKAAAVRGAREEVGWLAGSQWGDQPPMQCARISYVFNVVDKRRRDIGNLLAACKPFEDGLVDAGVIFEDDAEHLKLGTVNIGGGLTESTWITLEEIVETKHEHSM